MAGTSGSSLYEASPWPVRADLGVAHARWLTHVARPGTWWTGAQRLAFVAAVWDAIDHPDRYAPWDAPEPPPRSPLPEAAFAMAHRLGRAAATTTRSWYDKTVAALADGAPAFVELAALAAGACAVGTFGPALGVDRPTLPAAEGGDPSRLTTETVEATMNWVPVVAPADERPPVVQAFERGTGRVRAAVGVGRRPVHPAGGDGAARLATAGFTVAAASPGAGRGPVVHCPSVLLLNDRPRRHAPCEQ